MYTHPLRPVHLPSLPLPTLCATADTFVGYVRPLVGPSGRARAVQAAASLASHPTALAAQALLGSTSPSYIAGLWQAAYEESRLPLPVHVSPALTLAPSLSGGTMTQVAARIVATSLRHRESICNGLSGLPGLDCVQDEWLFHATRIPRRGRDVMARTTGLSSTHATVVVSVRNSLFELAVSTRTSLATIESRLQECVAATDARDAAALNVGALTSTDRDTWADAYPAFAAANPRVLASLQRAAFVLALDPDVHVGDGLSSEAAHHSLVGPGYNRWWDKLQVAVTGDGSASIVLEHTPLDGMTALRWCDAMSRTVDAVPVEAAAGDDECRASVIEVTADDEVRARVADAEVDFGALGRSVNTSVLVVARAKELAKRAGISPDAYCQVAFQLAYHRLHGRLDSVYESCSTAHFVAGRTEAIRSVTDQSSRLCTGFADATPTERLALLRRATEAHTVRVQEARAGRAVDRHLYALSEACRHLHRLHLDTPVPELFDSPEYERLVTSTISTSQVSHPAFTLFAFGPVVADGIGIAYNLLPGNLNVTVSSFTDGGADRYAAALREAFADLETTLLAEENPQ